MLDDYDILVAYQQRLGLVVLDDIEQILASGHNNPESLASKRELFTQLSLEAKMALSLIWNCPKECLDILYSPKTGITSPTRVKRYLKEQSTWDWRIIDSIVDELRHLAKNL